MKKPGVAKFTLEIPDELGKRLKHRAIDEGKTFYAVVRELIEAGLRAAESEAATK